MAKAKAVNRGKLGWAVEYNNSAYLSAMPDKESFSIAHEDSGGGFLIEEFKPGNIEWLEEAAINTGNYPSQQ